MLNILKQYGLYNFTDIMIICLSLFCLGLFLVRAALSIFYIIRGVPTVGIITSCEYVVIRKSKRPDKEDVTANKYGYEYKDETGTLYNGIIAGYYAADKFSQGDQINIRYLLNNPEKSRYYTAKDFMQFELMFLVIALAAVLSIVLRILWV